MSKVNYFAIPAGVPASIASTLNREIIAAMETPQVRGHIEKDAVESRAMTPAQLTAFIAGEMGRWHPLIRRALTGK